jgi:flagellar hook-basal body complex protein FliE
MAASARGPALQREFSLDNPTVSLEGTMVAMQKSQIGFQAAVQGATGCCRPTPTS